MHVLVRNILLILNAAGTLPYLDRYFLTKWLKNIFVLNVLCCICILKENILSFLYRLTEFINQEPNKCARWILIYKIITDTKARYFKTFRNLKVNLMSIPIKIIPQAIYTYKCLGFTFDKQEAVFY